MPLECLLRQRIPRKRLLRLSVDSFCAEKGKGRWTSWILTRATSWPMVGFMYAHTASVLPVNDSNPGATHEYQLWRPSSDQIETWNCLRHCGRGCNCRGGSIHVALLIDRCEWKKCYFLIIYILNFQIEKKLICILYIYPCCKPPINPHPGVLIITTLWF